jgi:cytochrome P450 family 33
MPIVTVNDYDTIIEMFVKDGDSYADRPYLEVFTQLTRGGNYGIVATSGPLWQEQRRFALKVLKDFGLGKNQMQDLIIEELQAMLDRINKDIASGVDEHDFHKHTDLAVGSIINNLCCGYRFTQSPEKEAEFYKLKQIVSDMMKAFSDPFVGLCLFFAIFRKLPPFKTKFFKAIDYFNQIFAFLDANIEKHQKENDYHTLSEARDFIDAFLMEKTKLDEKGEEHYFS